MPKRKEQPSNSFTESRPITCKRTRRPKFTQDELNNLVDKVSQKQEVLLEKFSNVISLEEKSKGWQEVTAYVNTVSTVTRTVDEVRRKWHDWSSVTKAKEARRRLSRRRTGAGDPADVPKLNEIEEKVVSLLGTISLEGVPGGIDTEEELVFNRYSSSYQSPLHPLFPSNNENP